MVGFFRHSAKSAFRFIRFCRFVTKNDNKLADPEIFRL